MTIHLQGAILPLGVRGIRLSAMTKIAQRRNVVELSFGVIKARFEYVLIELLDLLRAAVDVLADRGEQDAVLGKKTRNSGSVLFLISLFESCTDLFDLLPRSAILIKLLGERWRGETHRRND